MAESPTCREAGSPSTSPYASIAFSVCSSCTPNARMTAIMCPMGRAGSPAFSINTSAELRKMLNKASWLAWLTQRNRAISTRERRRKRPKGKEDAARGEEAMTNVQYRRGRGSEGRRRRRGKRERATTEIRRRKWKHSQESGALSTLSRRQEGHKERKSCPR